MSLEADKKLIQTQVGEPCTVITRELTDDDTISMVSSRFLTLFLQLTTAAFCYSVFFLLAGKYTFRCRWQH